MATTAVSTTANPSRPAHADVGLDTAIRARHLAAFGGAEWHAAAARPADRLQAALGTVAAASYAHPGKIATGAGLLTVWACSACAARAWSGGLPLPALSVLAVAAPTLLLLLGLLLLRWQRWAAAATVLAPVLAALAWTFGIAGRLLAPADPLLGVGVAVLLAAGVGHSAHLYDRYQLALARGMARARAVHIVFHHEGRGAAVAALLVAGTGLGLGVFERATLRACGLLLGLGLCAVLVASHALLPALLRLAPRERLPPAGPALAWGLAARAHGWIPSLSRLALLGAVVAAATTPWPGLTLPRHDSLHRMHGLVPWFDLSFSALPAGLAVTALLVWLLRDVRVACLALVPPATTLIGLALFVPRPSGGPSPVDLLGVALGGVFALGAGLQWAATAAPDLDAEAGFASAARNATHGLAPAALAAGVLYFSDIAALSHLGLVLLLGLALAALGCLFAVPLALGPLRGTSATNALADSRRREGVHCIGLAGYAPVAAGSFGALAAMPAAALAAGLAPSLRVGIAAVLAGVSLWSARRWWAGPASSDASHPVLAGFAGSLLALLCVPWQPLWVVVAFMGARLLGVHQQAQPLRRVRWPRNSSTVLSTDVVAGGLAGCLAALLRSWGIAQGWWS